MMSRFVRLLRRRSWSWGVVLALSAAVAATGLVRLYAVRAVEADAGARQTAVVESALGTIEEEFASLRTELHRRAEALAADSVVVQGLRTWRTEREHPRALSEFLVRESPEEYTTLEVYAPDLQLLGWTGKQMPIDTVAIGALVPARQRTTLVSDGSGRWALAAWVPVRDGSDLLGAVRVVRTVRYQPPVQNRYLQARSLESQWSRETGEMVRVEWEASPPAEPHRLLRSVTGSELGYVSVAPPSPDRLVARTASFYTDIMVLWVVLLLAWILFLAGRWHWRLARRDGLSRHPKARSATAKRLAAVSVLLVATRYVLLVLDVPSRWASPGTVLGPLFDPTHFASTIGAGIFRSIGDLLLTGLWAAAIGAMMAHLGRHYRPRATTLGGVTERLKDWHPRDPNAPRFLGTLVLLLTLSLAGIVSIAYVVRRAVLDSTLDFFSRTGLLPEPLVLGVLSGLFLLVVAGLLAAVGGSWIALGRLMRHRPRPWPVGTSLVVGTGVLGAVLTALYLGTDVQQLVSLPYVVVALAAIAAGATFALVGENDGRAVFTLRGLLSGVFAVTLLLYPLLYAGMDAKRQEHMIEAARSFEEGQDPRVLYSIRQVLRSASETLIPLWQTGESQGAGRIDSVATQLIRQSSLASVSTYDVQLSILDEQGNVRRQYTRDGRAWRSPSERAPRNALAVLRPLYEQSDGTVIEQLPTSTAARRAGPGRFQYAGLIGFSAEADTIDTWILVRVEPQSLFPGTGFGVPRVLLPDGSYGDLYAELSLAEFRGGTMVRSFGQDFGRTRLRDGKIEALEQQSVVWREEVIRGRRMLTYYDRAPTVDPASASVVAVRIPALQAFDHLYYLLRLTVAGLLIGLLAYVLGLYVRYRQGRLPAERVRFRNKVLNAFLVVGIVSMAGVGIVGVRLVTGENDRVVERRIRDQLARVEETLALEAGSEGELWRVAQRMDVDSLARRVGLDVHLYQEGRLTQTSQPRLLRDGLVDERLPGTVYHALYSESYRFAIEKAAIGDFRYRVGYKALFDSEGQPRLVVAVPTLAQQEQLQEEQSRTLAYLFGALLVLVVVVMLTGVVLANALAQPIAQLREGLEAVGEGRFARTLTVDTRDEIGDLVETFNEMRDQLAESRRQLARQERELAWREMARQVAHEIKNPLTPMKLSVQHLRRAYKQVAAKADIPSKFDDVFDRITSTLIEQVEALVRIADEFSTFARLPTRVPEPVDVNEVIEEAVSLVEQEAANVDAIELHLHDEPLVVEADREELRRLYINLLKNALQAIPEHREGCVRVITQRAEPEDGRAPMVESRVTDNGTGIPPDLRDKIFEPNFSTKTSGTGLGLAIAQKTLSELDGDIGFETTEGEGTTFWVHLPESDETPQES